MTGSRYDLGDPVHAVLSLDVHGAPDPSLCVSPTPGPVDHFTAASGTVTVNADRHTGTIQAALDDPRIGVIDVTATPPPIIEHIDGSWTC